MASFQFGGLVEQVATTATAGGTTTLTNTSKQIQIFTGSATQTVVLPNATTMVPGQKYEIYNESSASMLIEFQDASPFTDAASVNYTVLIAHTCLVVKLQTNGTANGTWSVLSTASSGNGSQINYITYGSAEAGTQGWHTVNWQQAVTITNASPAVFSVTSTTGMYVGMPIAFTTTGALPTGLTASTIYFISSIPSGSTFQVSATLGGAAVNTSSAGSGTHTSYPLVPINDTTVALSNLTFATSASSPLIGANSYTLVQTNSKPVGGQAAAYDFAIDAGYQAQVLNINVSYNASSTFVASSGSPGNDSDIEFAIWDKTNAVLIPVNPKFVIGNGSSNFTYTGTFQAAPNSTSYALMVYTPTMNANATGWTFKFDNVQVGPASTSSSNGQVLASYYCSTTGTSSSTQPFNFDTKIFDTAGAVTASAPGTGSWKFTAPVSGFYQLTGNPYNSTGNAGVQVYKNGVQYANATSITSATGIGSLSYIIQLNAGDFIDIRSQSSVTWGGGASNGTTTGNIQISLISTTALNGTGNSPTAGIAATYFMSTNTTPGTNTQLNFDSKVVDTNAAVTTGAGAWKFTAPASGFYLVMFLLDVNTSSGGIMQLYKNGSNYAYCGIQLTTGITTPSTTLIQLNAGDFIDVRSTTGSSFVGTAAPYNTYISICGIGAASNTNSANPPTTSASYYCSANFTCSTTVPINFDTKEFDDHAAVTPSGTAWKFTAPSSGTYQVAVDLAVTSSNQGFTLYKNGVAYKGISVAANASAIHANASALIKLVAGDFIDIRTDTGSITVSGGTLATTATSKLCILRVGN